MPTRPIATPTEIPRPFKCFETGGRDPSRRAIISVSLHLPFSPVLTADETWEWVSKDDLSSTAGLLEHLYDNQQDWDHFHIARPRLIRVDHQFRPQRSLRLSDANMTDLKQAWYRRKRGIPLWLGVTYDCDLQQWFLPDSDRWSRYGDEILSPAFRRESWSMPERGRLARWWQDYRQLNATYFKYITKLYRPGDILWIHDYHFFLLPRLLRRIFPDILIGFQLNTAFHSEELPGLCNLRPTLDGVLASNLIVFQEFGYMSDFRDLCNKVFTADEMQSFEPRTQLRSFGPYYAGFEKIGIMLADPVVSRLADILDYCKQAPTDRKAIISVNRANDVKDMRLALLSFESFLAYYKSWWGKVVLIQIIQGVPGEISSEMERPEGVVAHIGEVNARYGAFGFEPIRIAYGLTSRALVELLRLADVGFMVSAYGSISRYAFDYLVCQRDKRGPLIVSSDSLMSDWLDTAIAVAPVEPPLIAEQINVALTMADEEKAQRHGRAIEVLRGASCGAYVENFVGALKTAYPEPEPKSEPKPYQETPLLNLGRTLQCFAASARHIFFFDYDGTLAPIVTDPCKAVPSQSCLNMLQALLNDPHNSVWIISGRDADFLSQHFGHLEALGLCAEHGCFIRYPFSGTWENVLDGADLSWQEELVSLLNDATAKTPGSRIERKTSAIAWHYREAEPECGSRMASQLLVALVAEFEVVNDVQCFAGKCVVEVRPRVVSKGEVVKRLVTEFCNGRFAYSHVLGKEPEMKQQRTPGFIFCAGDDQTDEDMFLALDESSVSNNRIFTCAVGPPEKRTRARGRLNTPNDLIYEMHTLMMGFFEIKPKAEEA